MDYKLGIYVADAADTVAGVPVTRRVIIATDAQNAAVIAAKDQWQGFDSYPESMRGEMVASVKVGRIGDYEPGQIGALLTVADAITCQGKR